MSGFILLLGFSVILSACFLGISRLNKQTLLAGSIGLGLFSLTGFILRFISKHMVFQIENSENELVLLDEAFEMVIQLLSSLRFPSLIGCIIFALILLLKTGDNKNE